jgi:hypothetical protein
MNDIPDFRQLARDLTWSQDYQDSPIGAIEEALRRVWNARGAVDISTVNGTILTGNVPKLVGTLRNLQR